MIPVTALVRISEFSLTTQVPLHDARELTVMG